MSDLIIEILKLVVPTLIALVSLGYAIKQHNVVKKEISKKRYLESALSNLNDALKSLKDINMPNISNFHCHFGLEDEWVDVCNDAYFISCEILRAGFEWKRKKIPLEITYIIRDYGERGKPESEQKERTIENFDGLTSRWLIEFLKPNRVFGIYCCPHIKNFEQFSFNDIDFDGFELGIMKLKKALEMLSPYEEVYETVSPNSFRKLNELFEDIVEEIFDTISKSRTIEIDLDKFSDTNELIRHLIEKTLNYSNITEKFSRVSELVSELSEARKELFLRIS